MSPLSRCGIPQANSITSSPRVTSPSASESTLPCSAVRIRATSSRRSCRSSRMRNISSARFASEVARQAGNAAFAAATAAPTSSTVARSTSPVCSPGRGCRPGSCGRTCPRRLAADPVADPGEALRCSVGGVASSVMPPPRSVEEKPSASNNARTAGSGASPTPGGRPSSESELPPRLDLPAVPPRWKIPRIWRS